ncbi:MAG: hypothetical protein ABIK65_10680 [Candidatus Eisenbacteria bacterium]
MITPRLRHRLLFLLLTTLVTISPVLAGDNPNIRAFIEFDNDSNYIEPVIYTTFGATIYLENFGPGGGTEGIAFQFEWTFEGDLLDITARNGGLLLGDQETGYYIVWTSCQLPDIGGRVAVADLSFFYYNTSGVLRLLPHPSADSTAVVDCSEGPYDYWCVRSDPSGHGGVWVAPPAGDCPAVPVNILVPGDAATIQGGIDLALYGDTVTVAAGTYHEHDIIMKSGVYLRGATGDPADVIIDADSLGRVLYFDLVDSNAVVEGLTLTGGYLHGTSPSEGGGVSCYDSYPRFFSCVITGNTAVCTSVSGDAYAYGGGVALINSSPRFTGCLIAGNNVYAGAAGHDAYAFGGGVSTSGGIPEFVSCTSADNGGQAAGTYSEFQGSGLAVIDEAVCSVRNSIVAFNEGAEGLYQDMGSTAGIACTDIYGNSGGDWVGEIAPLDSVDGNFHADPLFCGAGGNPSRPYSLQAASPCATDSCGLIGADSVGCGTAKQWFGGGDGISWEDPDNWDPYGVPGPDDDVYLDNPVSFYVQVQSRQTVGRLTLGGPGSEPWLYIGGDTLTVTNGGSASAAAAVEIDAGGFLQIGAGAEFENGPGAEVDLLDGGVSGPGLFVNGGAFTKSDPMKSRSIGVVSADFENRADDPGDGAIEVAGGTLAFEAPVTNDGEIIVRDGATATFDPGDGPLRGDVLVNSGVITVESGGTLLINDPISVLRNLLGAEIRLQGTGADRRDRRDPQLRALRQGGPDEEPPGDGHALGRLRKPPRRSGGRGGPRERRRPSRGGRVHERRVVFRLHVVADDARSGGRPDQGRPLHQHERGGRPGRGVAHDRGALDGIQERVRRHGIDVGKRGDHRHRLVPQLRSLPERGPDEEPRDRARGGRLR